MTTYVAFSTAWPLRKSNAIALLVRKSEILDGSRKEIEKAFKAVRKLRDKLAHANTYAQNETQAKSVCATVRTVYQLKSALIEYLSESPVLE